MDGFMIAEVPQSTFFFWQENRSHFNQPRSAPTSRLPERFIAVTLTASTARYTDQKLAFCILCGSI
jgi:hypothetical protein